jgi:phosphate-selective porin OprO and OprP
MIRKLSFAALLSATFLTALPAQAQPAVAEEIAALRGQLEAMSARLEAVEARAMRAEAALAQAEAAPAEAPAAPAAEPEIRFRGAPEIRTSSGWSFKPRGRLQYDFGTVSRPDGINDSSLGFGNEIRRARLGIEGSIPGGFGYVFEADFADNDVEITDAILTYKASDTATLTIGQHNNFPSLEEVTSSRFTSFIERAAFTDAFNFERRVGLSATVTSGDFIAQAGLFTDNIADLGNDENNAVGVDGRIVFAPELGETGQLHLGASAHWRDLGDPADAGATTRYRQRPLVHFTDVRFVATPALGVEQESSYGLEAAFIQGPFHAAAEAHWLDSDLLDRSSRNFFGGYAEIGYFLTGETRGYRNGRWDRTSVKRPVGGDEGGFGALQLNLRYDHLDLNSAPTFGGIQNGFQAALIWIPSDYVRFLLNYGRMSYDDAALPAAGGNRAYDVDVLGARAQIDF